MSDHVQQYSRTIVLAVVLVAIGVLPLVMLRAADSSLRDNSTIASSQEGEAAKNIDPPPAGLSGEHKERPASGSDAAAQEESAAQLTLSGHVVDDATGKPISNFSIQGGRADDKTPAKITWGYSLETRGNNPDAIFSTNVQWSAGWRCRIVASGYVPQPILADLPKGAATGLSDLIVRMKRGNKVMGHVFDFTGKLVNDAGVYVVGNPTINLTGGKAMALAGGFVDDTKAVRVATDANGFFSITGIGEKGQRLAITCPAVDLWVVPLPEDDAARNKLDIHLPQPGKLVVHYDIVGAPEQSRIILQFHTWELPGWDGASSDRYDAIQQHVDFVLDNLAPGEYTIDRAKNMGMKNRWDQVFLDRQTFKIESGKTTVIDFVRPIGAPITGQVVGLDRTEVANAKPVRVYVRVLSAKDAQGEFPPLLDSVGMEPGEKPMDGKFITERIPPGQYIVRAEVYIPETPEQMHTTGWPSPAFAGEAMVTVPEKGPPEPVQIPLKTFKQPAR
jgi:hypothetical protein